MTAFAIHWPSFWIGVVAVPVGLVLVGAIALALSPDDTTRRCDNCSYRFGRMRGRSGSPYAVTLAAGAWHRHVISRRKAHRASWTAHFEELSREGGLRAKYKAYGKRYGTKGHVHE